MVSRSYCHYFGRLPKVVPGFVKVLVTWCKNCNDAERAYDLLPLTLQIYSQGGFLWDWSLILAEVVSLWLWLWHKTYKCHGLQIELLAQQEYWRVLMKGDSKLSTTNLPISTNWCPAILFDWNLRIYRSYKPIWRLRQLN